MMRHQDQVAEARKLLSYLDTRTTAMTDSIYRNPVSDYTCPQQAGLERECSFGAGRSISGWAASCRIPVTG
jgi:hypothetical protein